MRRLMVMCCCALVAASCYDSKPKVSEFGFETGRVLLGGKESSVFVDVEIADSDSERAQGLMKRDSLPEDAGMLFVYFEPTTAGFWMKDTRIPLSIAFIDEEETIIGILDMDPCTEDPCPTYGPEVEYVAALEVNQGAFEEWGIEVGDTVRVLR